MKIHTFKVLDEYMTPPEAVAILLPYLKPNSKIWCPFDDDNSQFVKILTEAGHIVEYSHLKNGNQQNFFNRVIGNKIVINWECDYIISNPPWSIKDKILTTLSQLDIPFAMLLPTYCLGGKARYSIFKNQEIQLLVPKERINYITEQGIQTKGNAFHSSYFCYKILPKQIIFTEIEKVQK